MTSREFTYISEMGKRIESKLDSILVSLEVGKDAENRSNNTAKSDCEIPDKSNGWFDFLLGFNAA